MLGSKDKNDMGKGSSVFIKEDERRGVYLDIYEKCEDCVFLEQNGYNQTDFCTFPLLDTENMDLIFNIKSVPKWCPLQNIIFAFTVK